TKSTVGAGDSSLAGFLKATLEGKSPEDILRTAASFGTAACLTEGTNPPEPKTVDEIYKKVEITKI
ncbi:MAG: PfkB family carbohydrate kinase, partial [Bacillota bacterium]|nr:PfkB family carbohydrate kinase [Bacillota bacterium]